MFKLSDPKLPADKPSSKVSRQKVKIFCRNIYLINKASYLLCGDKQHYFDTQV